MYKVKEIGWEAAGKPGWRNRSRWDSGIVFLQRLCYTETDKKQRKGRWTMTIEVNLSAREFRNFTVFDVLRRRKQWQRPVIFAAILGVSSAACFSMSRVPGAVLLGNVLLTIGLGLPCVYFAFFFSSLQKQIRQMGLVRPQKVYTVKLTEKTEGISADNGRETMTYSWKSVHHAYRALTAVYLYLTPQRALILPDLSAEDPEEVWKLITRKLPKEKCTIL